MSRLEKSLSPFAVGDWIKEIYEKQLLRRHCDFPKINHGILYNEKKYKASFPVSLGKIFYYSCEYNYMPPSKYFWTPITCTEGGWSPTPKCLKKCLKTDIVVANGFLSESEYAYSVNKETQYKCKPGYTTADGKTSGTVQCLQGGWSSQPTCIKSCERPVLVNARVKMDFTWFQLNDMLNYECDAGYKNQDGHTTGSIVCGEDGWSHLPICRESGQYCGPPPSIGNGDITSFPLSAYPPGSNVQYRCQSFYELRGNLTVTCRNGRWSEPPTCIDACIISEDRMNKNNIQLKWRNPPKRYAKTGDFIEFECKHSHKERTPIQSFRVLCQEGKFEYPACE
ncbi:TPA: complement factor H-related 4-like [Bos taurus]|nr:TPA: complement factor H-related 4-like [Bos taurus]